MATEFKIDGLSELDKALKQLPARVEKNVMRGTIRAAAMVVRNQAKQLVPVKTGNLKRSLRVSGKSKGNRISAEIIAGGGKKNVYYAHMVEFGTKRHTIKAKSGKALNIDGGAFSRANHPGIAPRSFMRTAMDTSTNEAFAKAVDYAKTRLIKEVEKLASRTNRK